MKAVVTSEASDAKRLKNQVRVKIHRIKGPRFSYTDRNCCDSAKGLSFLMKAVELGNYKHARIRYAHPKIS